VFFSFIGFDTVSLAGLPCSYRLLSVLCPDLLPSPLLNTLPHVQVATAAEETKDPAKSLPIGIVGSLCITTVLYVLM